MIIDVHAHYTTAPPGLQAQRGQQIGSLGAPTRLAVKVSDDEIRTTLEHGQLQLQRERGIDLTVFSPTAGAMGHHFGGPLVSRYWSEACNDLIHRACQLYPDELIGVCQLPQSPGVSPASCVDELERCVRDLGFVGCNLNPDPSGGYWTDPPLTDQYWYPLYEKMVELGVPAMIHVSASCNPNFHSSGAHYLNGDTSVFMQCVEHPQLFRDFPSLRFVIPHGGGAVPYQWGRFRGMALNMHGIELDELIMGNIVFDTCVYHQRGMDLLVDVVGARNVVFASELIGAVRGVDPRSGHAFDDTRRYVEAVATLDPEQRARVFEGTARAIYPRLAQRLDSVTVGGPG